MLTSAPKERLLGEKKRMQERLDTVEVGSCSPSHMMSHLTHETKVRWQA